MVPQGLESTEVMFEFLVVNVQGMDTRSLTKTYYGQRIPSFFIFWVISKDFRSQLHMVNLQVFMWKEIWKNPFRLVNVYNYTLYLSIWAIKNDRWFRHLKTSVGHWLE